MPILFRNFPIHQPHHPVGLNDSNPLLFAAAQFCQLRLAGRNGLGVPPPGFSSSAVDFQIRTNPATLSTVAMPYMKGLPGKGGTSRISIRSPAKMAPAGMATQQMKASCTCCFQLWG